MLNIKDYPNRQQGFEASIQQGFNLIENIDFYFKQCYIHFKMHTKERPGITEIKVLTEEEIYKRMTPEDLENARELLRFAAGRSGNVGRLSQGVSLDEVGVLLGKIDELVVPLREKSEKWQEVLEERKISRRELLGNVIGWGIATVLVAGGGSLVWSVIDNSSGPTAQKKDFAYRQSLETRNTLGLAASVPSLNRWTVRYAPDDLKLIPAGISSDPLTEGVMILLQGSKLGALDKTGIIIKDHIRTTDNQPVGRLAIATSYDISNGQYVIGEEWVLRNQSTEGINAKVLIFENLDSTKSTQYLSIVRSRTNGSQKPTFTLQGYKQA
ncbi:hypothetical protein M1437_03145 [Patescibacteria group bacterium]|nr:hypothetical protein [Patescibacteria group bacterium]